jgi:cell division protein FtsW (lipid II flippase)
MSATTMSYGIRARERMPFAWDGVTLGLTASLLLVGLVMVTSASMSIAAKDLGDPFYFPGAPVRVRPGAVCSRAGP